MEKLHKYCLSVLLVMICSNISAQANSCSAENDSYKRLYEVYSTFLNAQNCNESHLAERKNTIHHTAIHQKQNFSDLIEITSNKQYNFGLDYYRLSSNFENERHDRILADFEKRSRKYRFTEAIYFKNKVSKIRNKDYLNLIS